LLKIKLQYSIAHAKHKALLRMFLFCPLIDRPDRAIPKHNNPRKRRLIFYLLRDLSPFQQYGRGFRTRLQY